MVLSFHFDRCHYLLWNRFCIKSEGMRFERSFNVFVLLAPARIGGMKGYWIMLEPKNKDTTLVEKIILEMGNKPNKVHGKNLWRNAFY